MPPDAATDPLPVADAMPRFDWREWLAFVGAVLGTGLFVSVVLGILVLIISTQASAQTVDAARAAGELAQGATPAALQVATGLLLLALALLPVLRRGATW